MPKVMKTCRVCGRSYEACRTVNNSLGVFRWQDVACSPECGSIYLQKLNESRGIHMEKMEEPEMKQDAAPVSEPSVKPAKRPTRKKKAKAEGVVPLRLEAEGSNANTAHE